MASQDDVSLPESSSPEESLPLVAAELNTASIELAGPVQKVENYLDRLNLGVATWVKVKGWEDRFGEFWKRELGYDWIDGGWRIGIRETKGHEAHPDETLQTTWSFNQSPRKARISAVDKLPDLLKELTKEGQRTARRLREKTATVEAFVATLKLPAVKTARK